MLRLCLLAMLVVMLVGCRQEEIPRQPDAVAQYLYAHDECYVPALAESGDAKGRKLRVAVRAFQAVVTLFPDDASATTRALAEYYTGVCQAMLGESGRARESFLRCRDYRRLAEDGHFAPAGRTHHPGHRGWRPRAVATPGRARLIRSA